MSDPSLANSWPASKVQDCLNRREEREIIRFLRDRYYERFFEPLKVLRNSLGNEQGHGFAIMALCCLLIETLQSYRDGLASTNRGELSRLAQYSPPPRFAIHPSEWPKSGEEVFERYFATNSTLFPNVDGREFYRNIRNGLLHQAQTKDGWLIKVRQEKLCDASKKIIDRDEFAKRLEDAFERYLAELEQHRWTSSIWQMAERKVWWLIRLSL